MFSSTCKRLYVRVFGGFFLLIFIFRKLSHKVVFTKVLEIFKNYTRESSKIAKRVSPICV
jgi:hypothetical protein